MARFDDRDDGVVERNSELANAFGDEEEVGRSEGRRDEVLGGDGRGRGGGRRGERSEGEGEDSFEDFERDPERNRHGFLVRWCDWSLGE